MTGDKNDKMLLILRARLIAYVIHMWTEKLFIKPFPSAILWQEEALICFIVYGEYACNGVLKIQIMISLINVMLFQCTPKIPLKKSINEITAVTQWISTFVVKVTC